MVADNNPSISDLTHLSGQQATQLLQVLLTEMDEAPDFGMEMPTQIDQYLIEKQLGQGSGGTVYRGVRKGSERRVAVKLMHAVIDQESRGKRAWRELELLEQLHLPGFPHVYDYGLDHGRLFIVSDHIAGKPLLRYCLDHDLDGEARVRLLIKVARNLQTLHEHGVIHRDLKPSNVLVDHSGEPVIIDLGIAMLIDDDRHESLTLEGSPIGSPAYMPPEQARGELKRISTRSDLYSFTAMACEVLTGQTPHDVKVPLHEAIRRVAQEPPRPAKMLDVTLPTTLANIIDHGLAMEPEHRYASASEMVSDFQHWLDGRPIEWQKPGWLERQRMLMKRNPKAWFMRVGVWIMLLLVIGTSYGMYEYKHYADGVRERSKSLAESVVFDVYAGQITGSAPAIRGEEFVTQPLERKVEILIKFIDLCMKDPKGRKMISDHLGETNAE
ncbi:MAG: serine/threonine-protein kinase [Planctomycetota bacterium]|nr:serine/threonine-protein kinase [Planctomycetota bacterium]